VAAAPNQPDRNRSAAQAKAGPVRVPKDSCGTPTNAALTAMQTHAGKEARRADLPR